MKYVNACCDASSNSEWLFPILKIQKGVEWLMSQGSVFTEELENER